MIYLFDNGKHFSDHKVAFVQAVTEQERTALRLFGVLLKVDPFRDEPGIARVLAEMVGGKGSALTPRQFFEGPRRWPVHLYTARFMSDEHIDAVMQFSDAWPTQRIVDLAALNDVRREAVRRAFLRAPVDREVTAIQALPLGA